MVKHWGYLTDIFSILMGHEACKVYEGATGTSGVNILVKICLDSVHRSTKSSQNRPDICDSRDTKAAIAALHYAVNAGCATSTVKLLQYGVAP
jgi:hypothetical protein